MSTSVHQGTNEVPNVDKNGQPLEYEESVTCFSYHNDKFNQDAAHLVVKNIKGIHYEGFAQLREGSDDESKSGTPLHHSSTDLRTVDISALPLHIQSHPNGPHNDGAGLNEKHQEQVERQNAAVKNAAETAKARERLEQQKARRGELDHELEDLKDDIVTLSADAQELEDELQSCQDELNNAGNAPYAKASATAALADAHANFQKLDAD